MFSHPNMIEKTEIIDNDTLGTNASNVETKENNELPDAVTQSETPLNDAETPLNDAETPLNDAETPLDEKHLDDKHLDDVSLESSDAENLEKMILSTGIRVGTPVKTKSMSRY